MIGHPGARSPPLEGLELGKKCGRGEIPKNRTVTRMQMTVAVAPSGPLSIQGELQLCRSALLYADSVTLISPQMSYLQLMAGYRQARDIEYLRLAAKGAPVYAPDEAERLNQMVDQYDRTSRADRRAQKKEIQQFFEVLRPTKELLIANAVNTLANCGYDELELAINEGILTIEPMDNVDLTTFGDDRESTIGTFEYFNRVSNTLLTGDSYPLFDQVTGDLVRKGVDAGILAPVQVARRRGRNAALANGFFDHLPYFEHATIDEILDIRTDLRKPLGKFREGVQQISKDIDINPEDPQFPHIIADEWTAKIAPALDEIDELFAENSSYRDLLRRGISDAAGLAGLTGLGSMVVAAGAAGGTPAATTLLLGGGVAAALGIPMATLRAMQAQWKDLETAKNAQFYFLYEANARLASPAS
ncbi:hypothetical protein ACFTS5_09645 [Nocardia sp. NPDC056952]|uniref:hypothetical protein n=1 Tax=Nocardia sp. NPDC056952 TaxID=3345979 RepID=UPI00364576B5